MKTIKCTLPNASHEINGVSFSPADGGGVVSGPLADDVADSFVRIPGYEASDVKVEPTAEEKAAAKAAAKSTETKK